MSNQIIVLGMHRSGTSLLANILIELGVRMGSDFIEPDEFNPRGYFEDMDFVRLNKQILSEVGGDWDRPPARKKIETLREDRKFVTKIKHVIQIKNNSGDTWGWKDPRTCLTAFLYHPYLDNPTYIVITRNERDILTSLIRRGNGAIINYQKLIRAYNDHLDAFIQNENPGIFRLDYNDLVSDRYVARESLGILCESIGICPLGIGKAMRVIEFNGTKR